MRLSRTQGCDIPDSYFVYFDYFVYAARRAAPAQRRNPPRPRNHQRNTGRQPALSISLSAPRSVLTSPESAPPMKPLAPILGLALALAGCSQLDQAFAPPPPSALSQPIQAAEIDWSRKSGANTVSGIATMKAGDTTHTCGGQAANLVPDSAYARARMTAIFGNDQRGTRASAQGPVKFDRDDPLYVSTLRRTTCDASGSFSFPRVPDGVWYVTTSVKWDGPADRAEGGSMMKRVDVRGGKLVKVTLP